jgi:uncharacterized membrane protein
MLALYGRPHSWNWLLMFHVISAFTLLAAALVVTCASVAARRSAARPEATLLLRQIALRANLFLAVPAFLGLHIFGMVLADKEYPKGTKTPGWLDAGFGLTDLFGIVGIVILSLLQWWALRRTRAGKPGWQGTVSGWLAPASFALLLVVLFLMAGKPGQ